MLIVAIWFKILPRKKKKTWFSDVSWFTVVGSSSLWIFSGSSYTSTCPKDLDNQSQRLRVLPKQRGMSCSAFGETSWTPDIRTYAFNIMPWCHDAMAPRLKVDKDKNCTWPDKKNVIANSIPALKNPSPLNGAPIPSLSCTRATRSPRTKGRSINRKAVTCVYPKPGKLPRDAKQVDQVDLWPTLTGWWF